MPLYEYKCNKCNQVFEVLQRFSDAPIKVHEVCGGKVHRLLTAPTFKFKGSGFYITDYANKHSSSAAAESGASNGSNGSDGANGKASTNAAAPAPPSTPTTASKPAPAASSSEK
jgi:putative FmdB family regulatory protein